MFLIRAQRDWAISVPGPSEDTLPQHHRGETVPPPRLTQGQTRRCTSVRSSPPPPMP